MRMFAKFLVYTNLILSLIFLGWAIGLYTQRLDWAPHKNIITGEKDEKSGRLYHALEEIKELVENRDLAEKRWQIDAAALPQLEDRRLFYQKWYDNQLEIAKKGRDTQQQEPKDRPPIIQLIRDPKDPSGLFITDPKQLKAVQSRGQDVKSIAYYEEEYAKLKEDIDKLQKEIIEQVEKIEALTYEVAGKPGKTPGLRKKVDDLVIQKKEYDDEVATLTPRLAAQKINVEQQKRRLEELEKRLAELQKLHGLPPLVPVVGK